MLLPLGQHSGIAQSQLWLAVVQISPFFFFSQGDHRREANRSRKNGHDGVLPRLQTQAEGKSQDLCLLLHLTDLLSGTDYCCAVKGPHRPLSPGTEVHRSAVTSLLTLFWLNSCLQKQLEKHVRCQEHHLAIRPGIQGITLVVSPLLHAVNASGSCQALELGSRWPQGESSVLGRQGYLDSREMDARRKAPPCSSVIYSAPSKSWAIKIIRVFFSFVWLKVCCLKLKKAVKMTGNNL